MEYRICVPLTEETVEEMLDASALADERGADLVEFRLDALHGFSAAGAEDAAGIVQRLNAGVAEHLGRVFTCRTADEGGINPLPDAIRRAAAHEVLRLQVPERGLYLDAERADFPWVIEQQYRSGNRQVAILGSMHNFGGLPGDFGDIACSLRDAGADVVKMAVAPQCATDSGRLLAFFRDFGHPFVLAGMGLCGVPARLLAPLMGAEFTFGSLEEGRESAPGQVAIEEMLDLYRVREWTSRTPILGVIGNPLGHSLSPLLHNTVFGREDMDALYVPFQVTGDPVDFLEVWSGLGLLAASVTIPHKLRVMDFCQEVQGEAREIGAANTLKRMEGGGFFAANTDAPAVVEAVRAAAGALSGKTVLLLGAGGAARAAAVGLRTVGCRVVIANRTHDRAKKLAEETRVLCVPFSERTEVEYDVLVNATSVGMLPDVDASPMPENALREGTVVMDMVYNPLRTRLLEDAAGRGAITVPGTEMFVRQAAGQLRIWFEMEAPLDLLREVLLAALS